tara:strand:+ start:1115 stop:1363 length:249 start_codon:yes stop_codon:yes gene_type:complete
MGYNSSILTIKKGFEVPKILNILIFSFAIAALGCDEDNLNCEKVMVCEQDKEMFCYEMDNGCIDECHYWVFENCFEVCKHDG